MKVKEGNMTHIAKEEIPKTLFDRIEKENTEFREEKEKHKEEKEKLTVNVYFESREPQAVETKTTKTLKEFTEQVYQQFELESKVQIENIRIRAALGSNKKFMGNDYGGKNYLTLNELGIFNQSHLWIEHRADSTVPWRRYSSNDMNFSVYYWNASENAISFHSKLVSEGSSSLSLFKLHLASLLNFPPESIKIFYIRLNKMVRLSDSPDLSLLSCPLYNGDDIFIEQFCISFPPFSFFLPLPSFSFALSTSFAASFLHLSLSVPLCSSLLPLFPCVSYFIEIEILPLPHCLPLPLFNFFGIIG